MRVKVKLRTRVGIHILEVDELEQRVLLQVEDNCPQWVSVDETLTVTANFRDTL